MPGEISQTYPTNLILQSLPCKLRMTSVSYLAEACPLLSPAGVRTFVWPLQTPPIEQLSTRHQGSEVSSACLGHFAGAKDVF